MAFKTLLDIKQKVERDLDIEEEEFIQPEEFIEYVNDGISFAEAHIDKLGGKDKYFLTKSDINLVLDEDEYDLPSDILKNSIKNIVYSDGIRVYELRPAESIHMFSRITQAALYDTSEVDYKYLITHAVAGTEKLMITPPARRSVTNGLRVWYTRDANRMVDDTDICDLPEIAMQYLYQFIKVKVYEKEKGQEWIEAKNDLKEIEKLMIESLTQQIADPAFSEIEKDTSCYEEHS
jgi:hypothetical protein